LKQFLHRLSVRVTFTQILLLSGVGGLLVALLGGLVIRPLVGGLIIVTLALGLAALALVVFKVEHGLNVAHTELKAHQDAQQKQLDDHRQIIQEQLIHQHSDLVQQIRQQLAEQRQISQQYQTMQQQISQQHQTMQQQISQQQTALQQAIQKERSDRIVSFARRDSSGRLPKQALILLTVPRTGSTWLVDMLRSNPAIYMDPSARLFAELGLTGGRYPMGLSNGPDADMDFENMPNQGTRIPRFEPLALELPVAGANPYALEKIHPQYFGDDPAAFLERVEQLEAEHDMRLRFVYQIRDPRAVLSSFLNYKRRDPNWLASVSRDDLVAYVQRAYQAIVEMTRLRPDTILDYTELRQSPQDVLLNLYTSMWPSEDADLLRQVAAHAVEATRREKRQETAPGFLGATEGPVQGSAYDDDAFFEAFAAQVEALYEPYRALLNVHDIRRAK